MKPTSIRIYNTLSRKKEEFKPIKSPNVGIYACGVTVYDNCHIGHARSLYIFEVIKNFLEFCGFKVKFIRNITDIDDKIINKAKELGISSREVASKFIASYEKDLRLLNLSKADVEPKATEHIEEMKKLISTLIEKGYAYEADGNVYFSVKKFKGYGKLSNQSLDQMISGTRIEPGEGKQDPLDFALWKKSKEDEPTWPSPWGKGRPGWHIECSVMSTKYLGQTFDIHAGGRDLIFPHHENEIAQSEAGSGKEFARYWMHHGLLTINGQKMSKSLGNFINIKQVLDRYPAALLKIFYLQAHYSSPIDFSWDKMEEAKKAYNRIDILLRKIKREYGTIDLKKVITGGTGNMLSYKNEFIKHMNDDFNTPRALAVIFKMVDNCNKLLESNEEYKQFILRYAMDVIGELSAVLGLSFLKEELTEISKEEIESLILARLQLKKQKNFDQADKIRKNLSEKGVILEDSKEGTQWRRKI